MQYLEKALTLTKSCANTNCQCGILIIIAELKWDMGDTGTTQIHAKEARKLAKLSGNLYKEAITLQTLAHCTRQHGDYRNTIFHLQRAKEILGICGMHGGIADGNIESSRAEVHQLKSEYTDARSIHTHILQHSDQNPLQNGWALVNIAQIDVTIGGTKETVQQTLNNAKTILSTMKYSHGVTCCEMIWGDLQLREGDVFSAKDILQDCVNLYWGKCTEVVSFCLERFADRNRWHIMECMSPWPVVYLAHGLQSKEKLAIHKALLFLGDVFISQGDNDTAKSLFMVALEGFVYMDVHHSRAQCLLRLGDLANKKGDSLHAAELWMAARPLFEMSSQAKDVVEIDGRLTELEHNGKALAHLAALQPPGTIFEELSLGIGKSKIEEGEGAAAGQKSPKSMMLSEM
jgi:tetratricopeptide (TPR) repeat protein